MPNNRSSTAALFSRATAAHRRAFATGWLTARSITVWESPILPIAPAITSGSSARCAIRTSRVSSSIADIRSGSGNSCFSRCALACACSGWGSSAASSSSRSPSLIRDSARARTSVSGSSRTNSSSTASSSSSSTAARRTSGLGCCQPGLVKESNIWIPHDNGYSLPRAAPQEYVNPCTVGMSSLRRSPAGFP